MAVDLREGSATYGKWYGVELSEENKKQFLIPEGFAHGFLVLSDEAEFCYKVNDFWHPNDEGGLAWNDPDIGVEWPIPVLHDGWNTVDTFGERPGVGGVEEKIEKWNRKKFQRYYKQHLKTT